MRKTRFEISEVALAQVEQVYSTIKKLVNSKLYDTLYQVLNNTTLSAKQYYHLLDQLFGDNFFNDIKFAKILFSSELQANNDEYNDPFGEPLAQTLLYSLSSNMNQELICELFYDKESKIKFNELNICRDNPLQVLIEVINNFTEEQAVKLVNTLIFEKGNSINHINDFNKNALELFIYRKRNNKKVFEILIKEYYKFKENKFKTDVKTEIENYLRYTEEMYVMKVEDMRNISVFREKQKNMVNEIYNKIV